ncbi:MAG: hypothetical protein ACRD9R_08790, partial [Pyrinomonadaceae bacterium]
MKRSAVIASFVLLAALGLFAADAPAQDAARVATREKLRRLLNTAGPEIGVEFQQSEKQPFNFSGVMRAGLKHCDNLEIVIGVTSNETIFFRIFPHYAGSYINADKARNGLGLMRALLSFSDKGFLYWGIDSTNDVFAGYTFTLESGFPPESIKIVLLS